MWTPTHVKVTVHRARNLKIKGRSGANDSYAVIYLDDEKKFTTSVKTRTKDPEWDESFNMSLPSDLRGSVLKLSVYHRNLFGFDDLLGEVSILLSRIRIYERPQSRWYYLSTKHVSKEEADGEEDEGGKVQVTVTFMVQSRMTPHSSSSSSSERNFQRQRSLSLRSLANLVGMKSVSRQKDQRKSPLSELVERRLPLHSLVEIHNVSRCFHHIKLSSSADDDVFQGNQAKQTTRRNSPKADDSEEEREDGEEGGEGEHKVVFHISPSDSECSWRENTNNDNDFGDQLTPVAPKLVRKRSRSLQVRPRSLHSLVEESNDWKTKETVDSDLVGTLQGSCSVGTHISLCIDPNPTRADPVKRHSCIGSSGESLPMVTTFQLHEFSRFQPSGSPETTNDFSAYDRDGLIELIREQQSWMKSKTQYVHDLEKYIDELLVRVLETNQQTILENPYNRQNKKTNSDKSQKKSSGKMKMKHFIDLFKNGKLSEILS